MHNFTRRMLGRDIERNRRMSRHCIYSAVRPESRTRRRCRPMKSNRVNRSDQTSGMVGTSEVNAETDSGIVKIALIPALKRGLQIGTPLTK